MSRVRFRCPLCRASFQAPSSLQGEQAPCPRCRSEVASWPSPVSYGPALGPIWPMPEEDTAPTSNTGWQFRRWIWLALILVLLFSAAIVGIFSASQKDLPVNEPVGEPANLESTSPSSPKYSTSQTSPLRIITGRVVSISPDIESSGWLLRPDTRPNGEARYIVELRLDRGWNAQCFFVKGGKDDSWLMDGVTSGRHIHETITIRGQVQFEFDPDRTMLVDLCELVAR